MKKMPKPVEVAKPYRLRMKLALVTSGDSSEGPGNTEDEIYFSLAGIREEGGDETVMNRRTVRPGISRAGPCRGLRRCAWRTCAT